MRTPPGGVLKLWLCWRAARELLERGTVRPSLPGEPRNDARISNPHNEFSFYAAGYLII